MQLHKVRATIWHLYAPGAPQEPEHLKAEIHLDSFRQVESLVLRACTPEERLAAKRLAASHLAQYVRYRRTSNFLSQTTHRNPRLTDEDSDRLMCFSAIPEEIAEMTEEKLSAGLRQSVRVVEAVFANCVETIKFAIGKATELATSLEGIDPMIGAKPAGPMSLQLPVLFTVPENSVRKFRFWKSLSRRSDLHVIAPYHPAMQPDNTQVYLINGDTDALIAQSEHGVRYIHCPVQAARGEPEFFGSWRVNHPFYAEGHEVRIDIEPFLCVTAEAADVLTKILIATLGLNNTHVAVSGGFRAPERMRVRRTDRGSEAHALWGYRTLEQEGKLEGAHVPRWFYEEGYARKLLAATSTEG